MKHVFICVLQFNAPQRPTTDSVGLKKISLLILFFICVCFGNMYILANDYDKPILVTFLHCINNEYLIHKIQ